MTPLSIVLTRVAAAAGVALWTMMLSGAEREIGWIAWGLGGASVSQFFVALRA